MANLPRVSFIIPIRNGSAELRVALASCLAQTFDHWEAIILDDHSTEPIGNVVESFGDARFRYIRQRKGLRGIAAARTAAIAEASSPILITLDGDDINQPQRAGRCLQLLEDGMPMMIYTRVRLFESGTPHSRPKRVLQTFDKTLFEHFNFITNPGTAFNIAAYRAAGNHYDCSLEMAEDYDLYLRMSRAGVKITAVDEEHVCYRKHKGSITARRAEALHDAIMQVRRKYNIPPIALEAVAKMAQPELARNILGDPASRALWKDERWTEEQSHHE